MAAPQGSGTDIQGIAAAVMAALAVGGAATAATKRGLASARRRRALEDAVWGEGPATRENPHPEPGLASEVSFTKRAVVAIAEHVGADLSGIK